ncbi:MAG: phosphoadenosine phosphosulfate reductase family protein [Candidatus Thorarchaeota archaeon]
MQIGWCDICNVPLTGNSTCPLCGNSLRRIAAYGGELKPIFEKERQFYESVIKGNLGARFSELLNVDLCFLSRAGEIIIDGRKIFSIRFDAMHSRWIPRVMRSFQRNPFEPEGSSMIDTLKANQNHLKKREEEAISFIQSVSSDIEKNSPVIVSFSGGKDSTVTLALAKRAGGNLTALFLNTTIELEETVQYTKDFCEKIGVNIIEVTPDRDFISLARELGPPSRIMKWCCKTQKFGPLNRFIAETYPDGLLTFSGLRRSESNIRRKFSRVQKNPKVPKQVLAFPILDWNSFEVWLYLKWRRVSYNPIYELGYSRIGCWACPEKSSRDSAMIRETHPALAKCLEDILRRFAQSRNITDIDDWINEGTWKQWKNKWQHSIECTSTFCSADQSTKYTLEDSSLVDRISNFLRIFGNVRSGSVGTIIDGANSRISIGKDWIRIVADEPRVEAEIEKQIKRALNCVGCGACLGACKKGAISIVGDCIEISNECTHCLECLRSNGIRMSCIALNYKPDIASISSKTQSTASSTAAV